MSETAVQLAPQIESQVEVPQSAATETPAHWNLLQRVAFRFVAAYFILYNLPSPGHADLLRTIPGGAWVFGPYVKMWRAFVPWVATHVFGLSGPATVYPAVNGSGDSTLDYVQNFCFVAIAAMATLLWSVLDRRRPNYRRMNYWVRLWVRYSLAITLFSYGFAKVFPLQFRAPGFGRLISTYGDSSPMGILWTFMGASVAYTIFSGAMEVIGGALLLWRRTATIGAFFSAAVMTNVFVLNMCYDVPVKLYSGNLLLMAIFLMAPELGRLGRFMILRQPVAPPPLDTPDFGRLTGKKWMRIGVVAVQVLFVGWVLYNNVSGGWQAYKAMMGAPKGPLYGIYDVETFTQNGQERPPLLTDASRWKKILIQTPGNFAIRTMSDTPQVFGTEYNEAEGKVGLFPPGDKSKKSEFSYSQPDPEHVVMSGSLPNMGSLVVKLRRVDLSKFLLMNRGFRWINERPFNR